MNRTEYWYRNNCAAAIGFVLEVLKEWGVFGTRDFRKFGRPLAIILAVSNLDFIKKLFSFLQAAIVYGLVACLFCADFLANASEGFSTQITSQRLQRSWDATFEIFYFVNASKVNSGSAVLVKKQEKGPDTYLGFLTAGHVIQDLVAAYSNSQGKALEAIKLFPNVIYQSQLPATPVWMDKNMRTEIGFFVVKVRTGTAAKYQTTHFAADCKISKYDPLWVIGFPRTYLRPLASRGVPIANPWEIRKRVSEGFYLGNSGILIETQPQDGVPVEESTSDSLPGMSGGAVVNSEGDLAGIQVGSLIDSSNIQKYLAKSYFVSCAHAQTYSNTKWSQFLGLLGN